MLRNGLEPWHLLIVILVAVILFGSRKLPDAARALGKSMRILKSEAKALREDEETAPTVRPGGGEGAAATPADAAGAPRAPESRAPGQAR
ncbi:twin-arginine translocase TatA/TatE family subunit [Streptomyces solincola]|uniref:Sec-independent protein translocase protein TatA n=1 Tax=Streptomyces solincola TaxID=2100817 RepID=A0A2S9Q2E3_9ACTN|nr:Sec-independent protein translocase subunit TatA [Streptomyces solincola]PRH80844.1 twin-arginine translocase TatA/TatE family subunit [Streptomyces solincola]